MIKCIFILFQGVGKTHKDAASARASHPIPAACGIYYFEVKVISKGRDGSVFISNILFLKTEFYLILFNLLK